MDNVNKLPIIGRCYICGKPISKDEYYMEMEDSDTLYCEKCWQEYLDRSDAIIEQMRKERGIDKENHSLSVNITAALDEAAGEYMQHIPESEPELMDSFYDWEQMEAAFKAGAELMAGQGVNADFEVCKLANRAWLTPIDEKRFVQDIFDKFAAGDKVIVQIRKKE